ncbi:MAG TPA: alpha/beta hydrolase [Pirellulales bacterium]
MLTTFFHRTTLALAFAAALGATPIRAQEKPAAVDPTTGDRQVIPLWDGVAAGSEDWKQQEYYVQGGNGSVGVRNVVKPTLTVYPVDPAKANGTAVIVAPGGGFVNLAWTHEGHQVAEWLNSQGITAFVLKYRLVDTTPDANATKPAAGASGAATPNPNAKTTRDEVAKLAGEDGRQAVRIVRNRAAEFKVDPQRIGFIGFSAGGAVTMSVIMEYDEQSRPNFAAPIYGGSTNGAAIPKDAPPIFIACASDDKAAGRSVKTYEEWLAAGKSAELHMYAKGGHGFGMRKQNLPVDGWIERYREWLAQQGFLPTATAKP